MTGTMKSSVIKMDYVQHFILNIKVMLKCLVLAFFHIAHALLPIELTSHEYCRHRRALKRDYYIEQGGMMLEITGRALKKKGWVLRWWKKRTLRQGWRKYIMKGNRGEVVNTIFAALPAVFLFLIVVIFMIMVILGKIGKEWFN